MSNLTPQLVFVISAMAIMSFFGAIPPVAQAQFASSLQAQITALLTQIHSHNFTRDLTTGSRGDDVKNLQQFLNSHGSQVSVSEYGSPGNETIYFGEATKAALAQWQAINGISPAVGYFGIKSRSFIATVMATSTSPSSSQSPISVPPSPISSQIPQNVIDGRSVESMQNIASGGQVSSGLPIRLKIPKINVDAAIEYVGLTSDGAMDVPKGPANTGWFKLGQRPGENGSAVISGHYGWKNNMPAVFDNLHKLQKGDRLYVEDDKGSIISFMVRESRSYDQKADASDVFGSNDGQSHLNLITCEGTWNKAQKSYSNRLVVFTDRL